LRMGKLLKEWVKKAMGGRHLVSVRRRLPGTKWLLLASCSQVERFEEKFPEMRNERDVIVWQ